MTTKTYHKETTTAREISGTLYVRIPPSFWKYMNLKPEGQNMAIGMAEGKHGKFLWIQKQESD